MIPRLLCYLVLTMMLSGCATEFNLATGREESLLYGTEKEIKIGESVDAKIQQEYKIVEDVDVNERVEQILERIVEVCDRKDLVYFIRVIDEDIMNALSLPGGYVYIFKGLIDKVENDDQLAGVIAHEVGHITAKHGIKRLQSAYGALLLQIASTQTNPQVAGGVNFALTSLFLEYSQKAEFESDKLAVKYMKKAGYDPQEMAKFLKILQEDQDKKPLQQYTYWRTHPHIPQRISVVNQEVKGTLEFKDYLNLMEVNHY
ncbi:MAG: M48 family metalloprotease [Candidatus Omnitrophica bacterium]|nr:M48 family metalloprotease [Candidatus Omnitrophota bacterium]MCB9747555.1 M48 family metalloprotease [Candidatus Omnitrophota bacterium]